MIIQLIAVFVIFVVIPYVIVKYCCAKQEAIEAGMIDEGYPEKMTFCPYCGKAISP